MTEVPAGSSGEQRVNTAELAKALETLEMLARQEASPSHYVARHLLLSLGQVLLQADPGEGAGFLERTRLAGLAAEPAWSEAVRTELMLACAEFTQCLDPRYVNLPNYDLDYTRTARARLEDRLRAARALGFDLAERESSMLELADRVLSQVVSERPSEPPRAPAAPPPPPAGAKPSAGRGKRASGNSRRN